MPNKARWRAVDDSTCLFRCWTLMNCTVSGVAIAQRPSFASRACFCAALSSASAIDRYRVSSSRWTCLLRIRDREKHQSFNICACRRRPAVRAPAVASHRAHRARVSTVPFTSEKWRMKICRRKARNSKRQESKSNRKSATRRYANKSENCARATPRQLDFRRKVATVCSSEFWLAVPRHITRGDVCGANDEKSKTRVSAASS